MSNRTTLGIVVTASVLAITMALTVNTVLVKQALAGGGNCSSCASSFTPNALSSSLSGTGAHGAQHIFAPGIEQSTSTPGSASDFAPGHLKP